MKVRIYHAWYDMWRGAYWSSKKKTLYICPLPTIVIEIKFRNLGEGGEIMKKYVVKIVTFEDFEYITTKSPPLSKTLAELVAFILKFLNLRSAEITVEEA